MLFVYKSYASSDQSNLVHRLPVDDFLHQLLLIRRFHKGEKGLDTIKVWAVRNVEDWSDLQLLEGRL